MIYQLLCYNIRMEGVGVALKLRVFTNKKRKSVNNSAAEKNYFSKMLLMSGRK